MPHNKKKIHLAISVVLSISCTIAYAEPSPLSMQFGSKTAKIKDADKIDKISKKESKISESTESKPSVLVEKKKDKPNKDTNKKDKIDDAPDDAISKELLTIDSNKSMIEQITIIQKKIAIAKARSELIKVLEETKKIKDSSVHVLTPEGEVIVPMPKLRAVYGMRDKMFARIELSDGTAIEVENGDYLSDGWAVNYIQADKVKITKTEKNTQVEAILLLSKSNGSNSNNTVFPTAPTLSFPPPPSASSFNQPTTAPMPFSFNK